MRSRSYPATLRPTATRAIGLGARTVRNGGVNHDPEVLLKQPRYLQRVAFGKLGSKHFRRPPAAISRRHNRIDPVLQWNVPAPGPDLSQVMPQWLALTRSRQGIAEMDAEDSAGIDLCDLRR